MLHETCPEDLAEYEHRHAVARAPGALVLFGGPLAICAGVVLVGALHAALGLPLGEAWAAEVWSLAKTAITATMVYVPFAGYVRRHNAAALRVYQPHAQTPIATRGPGGVSSPPSHGRPAISPTGRYRALLQRSPDDDDTDDRGGPPP